MPLYEYQCEACGSRFEVIQKFSDPHVDTCTKCGRGPVQRLLSSPAFQFKGTGWYVTDYAQKGKSSGGDSAGDSGKAGASEKKEGGGDTATKSDSTDSGSKDGKSSAAPALASSSSQ